jgi:hypothetical protein
MTSVLISVLAMLSGVARSRAHSRASSRQFGELLSDRRTDAKCFEGVSGVRADDYRHDEYGTLPAALRLPTSRSRPTLWRRDFDTTVIRLLDGIRAYLHAVIDNFS